MTVSRPISKPTLPKSPDYTAASSAILRDVTPTSLVTKQDHLQSNAYCRTCPTDEGLTPIWQRFPEEENDEA